ncbi:MAG: TraB/GumN family protein [Gammaproteobacteria bacterium]|nr:TraB/GumN family protein [Gammaproteobacteria bacterium]
MGKSKQLNLTQYKLYWLLAGLLAFLLSSCAASRPYDVPEDTGLLWKIERANNPTSYLLGTIHSDDPRVLDIPEQVIQALDHVDQFVMEVLIDSDAEKAAGLAMYYRDGTTLESVIGKPLYRKVVKAMRAKGIEAGLVYMMKPWGALTILNMPEARSNKFLDVVLLEEAKKRGKELRQLETIQEQIAVFDEMDIKLQIDLLTDTVNNLEFIKQLMEETINVYLSNDLEAISHLNDRYLGFTSKQAAKAYDQRLLVDRNTRMLERLLPMIRKQSTLIAVGALHLPGEKGLIPTLREEGFTLTPIKFD